MATTHGALLALLAGELAARGRLVRYSRALQTAAQQGHASPATTIAWATPTESDWASAQRSADALAAHHIAALPVWTLPAWLQQLPQPPVVLYLRGNASLLQAPSSVAIVGSRQAADGPRRWAFELAQRVTRRGELVVSGGALGIDSAAHKGALAAGGPTLAFVGSAIDAVYPPANAALFARIVAAGGAIVSEHAPLARPAAASHARRNRFIVARSRALVVAAAALASGTMGAAKYARAYQVPIWVPPSDVGGQRAGIEALLSHQSARILPDFDEPFRASVLARQAHREEQHLRRAPGALQEFSCSK